MPREMDCFCSQNRRIVQHMSRYSTLGRLAELAEEQWGLITRQQALGLGVARRTLDRLTAQEGILQKVSHGVYRLPGAPPPDHEALRAAWLQLAPDAPAWERVEAQGVVSHRSAADMYGVGHLPEERHEFTAAVRYQSRRPDVRTHRRKLTDAESNILRGLPVTRPARIVSDLLHDNEDPGAVAHIITDSLRSVYESPTAVADALAPHAHKFGLRRRDGLALLRWMLDLAGDPEGELWISEARAQARSQLPPEREPATMSGSPPP
jgi:predicted transcriptional regulator of viral defense system